MSDLGLDPVAAGLESLNRIHRFVSCLGGNLGTYAGGLLARHGYSVGDSGDGPHQNVLGHPLFDLPLWLASSSGGLVAEEAILDVCESSLFGYLSVRVDDDYIDGDWDEPAGALMLSAVFRTRHQRLLASLISDSHFWDRFQEVWVAYGEAMLVERTLHDPGSVYGPAEYDVVLRRSQPLEIPAAAILALSDRWDMSAAIADIVGHLTKATQLFDDFVDAPEDLRAGNYTWMVRRLGGLDGPENLKRGMIAQFDQVISEAEKELDVAVGIGEAIGITDMTGWANARKEAMNRIVEVTYQALFGILARDD